MRHLGLQLIVERRQEAGDAAQGLTAPACKAGCGGYRAGARSLHLGTGRIIRGAGASRTSRRAAGASCASRTYIRGDRDLDGASRCGMYRGGGAGNAGFLRDLVANDCKPG